MGIKKRSHDTCVHQKPTGSEVGLRKANPLLRLSVTYWTVTTEVVAYIILP